MNRNELLEKRYELNVRYFNEIADRILESFKYCGFCKSYKEIFKAHAQSVLAGELLYEEWGNPLHERELVDILFSIDEAFQECKEKLKPFESRY